MLNTKLTETEAEGRLRMQGMSKDDLIEQILKVKVSVIEIMAWHRCIVSNTARPIPLRKILREANRLRLAITPEDPRTHSKGTTRLTIPIVRQMELPLVQSTSSSHSFRCIATSILMSAGVATPKECRTTATRG